MQKGKLIMLVVVSLAAIYYALTPTQWHFIDSVNLLIHEAGHVIFRPFGMFLSLLGGSLTQVLLPLIFVLYFARRREYFSASILLFWVGQNLINVSVYIGDAVVMQLPLLGGESVLHDWHTILSRIGALSQTTAIANTVFALGIGSFIAAVGIGVIASRK